MLESGDLNVRINQMYSDVDKLLASIIIQLTHLEAEVDMRVHYGKSTTESINNQIEELFKPGLFFLTGRERVEKFASNLKRQLEGLDAESKDLVKHLLEVRTLLSNAQLTMYKYQDVKVP